VNVSFYHEQSFRYRKFRFASGSSWPRLCENIMSEVNAGAACALISLLRNRRVGRANERFIQGECRTQSVLLPSRLTIT